MKLKLLATSIIMSTLSTAAMAGGSVDKIKSTGEIVLGVRASSAPFSSVTDKGLYQGYSIDICKKIVADFDKKYGTRTKITFKEVNTTNRYVMLDNQGIDLDCAASSFNPEKLNVASYAIHYTDSIVAATLSSSKINSLDDLAQSKMGIVSGFSGEKYVRDFLVSKKVAISDANLQKADNYDAMFMLLNQGRIDSAVTNKSLLMGLISKQKNPQAYKIVETAKIKENDRLGIVSWAKDAEFSNFVKHSVRTMASNGELEKLHQVHFGGPLSQESKRDINND